MESEHIEWRRTMGRTGTLVLAAVLGVAGGFAGSRIGNDNNATTPVGSAGTPHTVTVASTAAVGTQPDEATLSLSVSTDDPVSATAYSKNQATAANVIGALEKDGVAKKDIKTTDINLYSHTINRNTPSEQTVYTSSETITAVVHTLGSLGSTISDAVGAGATRVQGVTFGVSDSAKAREDALASAVSGARVKADTLAVAAGSHVIGVVRIQEGDVRTYGNTLRYGSVATALATPSALDQAIVAPHEIKTQVTVTVTWAIS
jgi:uncharacterized protein YggE